MQQKNGPRNKTQWEIDEMLATRKLRLVDLADQKCVSYSTLTKARMRVVPRGNRIIAKALGQTCHLLWPEWFDEDDNPIRDGRGSNDCPNEAARDRQKVAAA